MMNKENNEEVIIQNLKDAGCDEGTIITFLEDIRDERLTDGLKVLAAHRRSILDNIHKEQKQIDCLDYLVYIMQKRAKGI